MVKRIIFVGVHYKPGYTALDSLTVSGRLIDKTIEFINSNRPSKYTFEKSNFFPKDELPAAYELYSKHNFIQWAKAVEFNHLKDIPVALGVIVNNEFLRSRQINEWVHSKHPSAIQNHQTFMENILTNIEKINGQ